MQFIDKNALIAAALLALGTAVCAAPAAPDRPAASGADSFQEIESRVTQFRLSNGMTFLVLERHQAPVAAFVTFADVGSVQDGRGKTGLAHIFEHMAFKGTETIGTSDYAKERIALDEVDRAFDALKAERLKDAKADPEKLKQLQQAFKAAQENTGKFVVRNEFGQAIERAGGRGLNASTSADVTQYFFSLPSNEQELWFYLESERFRAPVLREFYKERDVVMEERRMRTDNSPIGRLIEEFVHAAYIAHPYNTPPIGYISDLENVTRADAQAFFKKYYIPSNLTCAVIGDVDPRHVRELAETYFGGIPSAPKPEPLNTTEPPQNAERQVVLHLASQPVLIMGYHKGDINSPDEAVYDAISSLLSEGRSSRLYRGLVRDRKIAVESEGVAHYPGEKYPGLFAFVAFPAQGHTNAECRKAIEEEIERLKTQPVGAEELDGVKRRARANLLRGLDDNTSLGVQLAKWQTLTGDWRNLFRDLDAIDRVTPEDIERVAKATFVDGNRTIGEIVPLDVAEAH
ncbi:MAG: pitrilysin family protein [Bryobacteraceae bacterium]